MDPQLTPGLVIRFLGMSCGASYGGMAAMYSDLSRRKAAASPLPAPHNEEHTHGDTSLPISSSAPSHAPGPAEPLRTVQQLGSHAATQAAKSIADSTFEQLCAIIGPEPGPGWDMMEVGYKQLQHYWLTVRSALNRAGMQLPAPAAPPVSSTAPPGWSMARMKRAEERGGKHKTTAGSQPLCGESPERPQPSRAEPLPAVRAQKQLPILEDAVVNQTQHCGKQRRTGQPAQQRIWRLQLHRFSPHNRQQCSPSETLLGVILSRSNTTGCSRACSSQASCSSYSSRRHLLDVTALLFQAPLLQMQG